MNAVFNAATKGRVEFSLFRKVEKIPNPESKGFRFSSKNEFPISFCEENLQLTKGWVSKCSMGCSINLIISVERLGLGKSEKSGGSIRLP
jgi:hypothetical protein